MSLPIHRDLKKAALDGTFRTFAKLLAAIVGLGLVTGLAVGATLVAAVRLYQDQRGAAVAVAGAVAVAWGMWGAYAWLRRPDPTTVNPLSDPSTVVTMNVTPGGHDPLLRVPLWPDVQTKSAGATNMFIPEPPEQASATSNVTDTAGFSVSVFGEIPDGFHARIENPKPTTPRPARQAKPIVRTPAPARTKKR